MVYSFCRSGTFSPDQFTICPDSGSCRMEPEALKRFIRAFEEQMECRLPYPAGGQHLTMRQCMAEQARQLAACCEKAPELPDYRSMELFTE